MDRSAYTAGEPGYGAVGGTPGLTTGTTGTTGMGTGMETTTGMHHTRVGAEADALYHEGKGHMPGTTEHAMREGETGTHGTGGGVMGGVERAWEKTKAAIPGTKEHKAEKGMGMGATEGYGMGGETMTGAMPTSGTTGYGSSAGYGATTRGVPEAHAETIGVRPGGILEGREGAGMGTTGVGMGTAGMGTAGYGTSGTGTGMGTAGYDTTTTTRRDEEEYREGL